MRQRFYLGLSLLGGTLIATGAILIGCSPDTSAPSLAPRTVNPTGQPTVEIASALVPAALTLEPFTDYACLSCHTDQTQLTTLAVPEESAESLSSGPG